MNIFVAKLNFKTTSSQLQALFEQFGTVNSCKIINDKETGRSKGFGFVEMADEKEANRAIDTLNESDFDGRTIAVQVSKEAPRKDFKKDNNSNYGNRTNDRGRNDRGQRGGRERDRY